MRLRIARKLLSLVLLVSLCLPVATASATSSYIAFVKPDITNGGTAIYRVLSDGTGLKRLTSGKYFDSAPAWSPDRKRIAFARSYSNFPTESALCFVASGGGTVYQYMYSGTISSVAWSPTGKSVAIADYRYSNESVVARIRIVNVADITTKTLYSKTYPTDVSWDLHWSPSGTKILIGQAGQDAEGGRIGVLDIASKTAKWFSITNATHARWSPSGKSILVGTYSQSSTSIKLATTSGTVTKTLLKGGSEYSPTNPNDITDPCWSPGGTKVLFAKGGSSGYLYMMSPSGTGVTKFVKGTQPAWAR